MTPTANLQPSLLTVKEAAKLMNVSERCIYMAAAVARVRPDLAAEVEAGRMSINRAHAIAKGKPTPTSWDRLVSAWNNATDDDRERLTFAILRHRKPAA